MTILQLLEAADILTEDGMRCCRIIAERDGDDALRKYVAELFGGDWR